LSEPARSDAAPVSLEERRADRKPKSHRWTGARRQLPKLFKVSPIALELYGELARRADNETGECHGYQAGFAAAIRRSPKSVQRATRELKRLQLIEYRPGHHRPGQPRSEACWFRLLPLEGRSHSPPPPDTQSAPVGGHTVRQGRSHSPPPPDTQSALTAVQTTQATGPPQPPIGGWKRTRDRESWINTELRAWVVANDLPCEHLRKIFVAIRPPQPCRDRQSVVAYLEHWADPWRDPWREAPPGAGAAVEQLTLGGAFAS
jgi:hypothetical protein